MVGIVHSNNLKQINTGKSERNGRQDGVPDSDPRVFSPLVSERSRKFQIENFSVDRTREARNGMARIGEMISNGTFRIALGKFGPIIRITRSSLRFRFCDDLIRRTIDETLNNIYQSFDLLGFFFVIAIESRRSGRT